MFFTSSTMMSSPFIKFFISWICVWNVVNSETTILCDSGNDCHVVCGADCVNGTINGTNANSLYVKCNSNKCADLKIQCPSTDCSIKCSGSYACDHIKIMAQYTNSVSLSAFGEDAFYKSMLLANKAESVNIKCTSDEYTACYNNEFHLPYGSHTTFNCYGNGCRSLGDLYMNSARGLQFNINGCGVCAEWDHPTSDIDMESCISSFYIRCWMTYEVYYIGDCGWKNSKYDCDCDDMQWSFVDKPSDDECYSPDLTGGEIAAIVLGSIAGIICICVFVYGCNIYVIKNRQKVQEKEQPAVEKISECSKNKTNTDHRFKVRNKSNPLEIVTGEKHNQAKYGPSNVTKKEVVDDTRKITVHSVNKTVEFVFRDLNRLDEQNIIYFKFISSIKSYFHLANDCSLSLYEKVNGQNICVDDMDDIIDSFEANDDDDNYVLHLYIASKFIGSDIQPDHADCLQIEGLQNMEQIRTDYEDMVFCVENNDNQWIINTAPHMQQDTSSQN
eukprot:210545_1